MAKHFLLRPPKNDGEIIVEDDPEIVVRFLAVDLVDRGISDTNSPVVGKKLVHRFGVIGTSQGNYHVKRRKAPL